MRYAFAPIGSLPLDTSKGTITFTAVTGTVVVSAPYAWKNTSPLKLFLGGHIATIRSATFRYEREGS